MSKDFSLNTYILKEIKYPIKKIKEKNDDVLLYLDEEKIRIPVDIYFKYSLKNLPGLDDELYSILKNEQLLYLSYVGCLKKLSIKDYTSKQISDYLYKQGLSAMQLNDILERLLKYQLVDDEKYAINRISFLNKSNYSYKQIKRKLINDGINEDIINNYLTNDYDSELQKAENIANKYMNALKRDSLNNKKQKIISKLLYQGFTYEIANEAMNSLNLSVENERGLLLAEYNKIKARYEKKYQQQQLREHIFNYLLRKGFNYSDIKEISEV